MTGDVIANVTAAAEQGLPQAELACTLPEWLTDEAAWHLACAEEAATYGRILDYSSKISDTRERTKAGLLPAGSPAPAGAGVRPAPITLAAIRGQLRDPGTQVLVASGETPKSREHVEQLFARDSRAHAIALCSEALNEGLNLQGAAALVHLYLPTTLRVAEQRVGRIDRMDSPHDLITVWWPEDGKAFATRQIEVLLSRRQASEALLGSNLPMPQFTSREENTVVDVEQHIRNLDQPDLTWNGIRDALYPVRRLTEGEDALVPPAVYAEHRHTRNRVWHAWPR